MKYEDLVSAAFRVRGKHPMQCINETQARLSDLYVQDYARGMFKRLGDVDA